MASYGKNEILTDVVLYLQTVLVAESLSERAEIQRQQLLEKLSRKEIPSGRGSYMDMNGCSKGMIMKSNSFACLHQQAAYEELCDAYQPIYNNVPYEENDEYDGGGGGGAGDDEVHGGYEPFAANSGYAYGPPKTAVPNAKRHSAPNGGCGDSNSSTGSLHKSAALNGGYSLSSRSNSDSSESGGGSRAEVMYVSANAVKYSASKYGALMKREKILFVDHTRKYWAAILSSTLYVYGGDKEPKPCLVVHLNGYTARDANGGGGNRKDWTFEVVCPGKKSYQFIAQNQQDMHSWIEAVNASCSKPSTPDSVMHSPSPPVLCFRQDQLPANRELPVPPGAGAPLDYCYDKPNPIIRPVNVYENPADGDETDESIYHFIDESKRDQDASATKTDDKQFWDGDTSYYNVPSNIPVMPVIPSVKEDRNNNNDYDGYFMAEKETSYDVVTNGACVLPEDPVLGVQQIIQKIEEINNKKSSPLLRRKSQPKTHHHHHHNNCPLRNSTPPMYGCAADEFYEPMTKAAMQQPNGVVTVCGSQSFRKSR